MKGIQQFNEYLDKNFDDVGEKFAEIAMKIHRGEEDSEKYQGDHDPSGRGNAP